MKTKTRSSENDTPQVMHIPKRIQKDINDRWFHLYRWISPDEVKLSIERDFLWALKFAWIPLAIISLLMWFISWLNIIVFFLTIFLGVGLIFLHLLLLSIKRSRLLSKSAFVVMTDSSVSLGWKIHKLSDISGMKKDMNNVENTFEEKLFWESRLSQSKKWLTQDVMEQLFWGYKAIFSMSENKRFMRSDKDAIGWMLVMIALYTAYIAIMACVYFIWVLFLLVLWKLITKANTWYLMKRWASVIKINSLFWEIDVSSDEIKGKKQALKSLLLRARENDWKDGLLLDINAWIESINDSAQDAVMQVLWLKNAITNSRYSDMFRFEIYNNWIKKQIQTPLTDILALLESSRDTLELTRWNIQEQIKNTKKPELKGPLKLQLTRIEMQIQETEWFIPKIQNSIDSLR